MARKRLKLVVLGMMARCPYGGQTWLYLNWLRALAAHGHEVWYVEDDPMWPYDPIQNTVTDDARYARKHLADSMARIGLADQWAYRIHGLAGACWGLEPKQLNELYASCDALLNIVGATDLREEQMRAPLRVYVETDPVTAELRLANGDEHTREVFATHHHLVTYGENYGAPDCGVPLCGLTFKTTRQPIDLELWPMHYDPNAKFFTTIGNYRQSGSDVEYKGVTYKWSKHHEWEKFIDLPKRTSQPFEVALNFSSDEEKKRIESFGWKNLLAVSDVAGYFRGVSGIFPEIARSVRRGERSEYSPAQRVVERAGYLLSGVRQTGDYSGYGFFQHHSLRRGIVRHLDDRGSGRGDRANQQRLRASLQGGEKDRTGLFRGADAGEKAA